MTGYGRFTTGDRGSAAAPSGAKLLRRTSKALSLPAALAKLAQQIDAGRVYDCDLEQLAESLDEILKALNRRPTWVRLMSRRRR